eukprot:5008454-Heterocapsa_arctica.AAC.1
MASTNASMRQEVFVQAPVLHGSLVGHGAGAKIALWPSTLFVASDPTRSTFSEKAHLTLD